MLMAAFTFGEEPVDKVIQVTTTITENPPAISFKWNQVPGHFEILIYRRIKNSTTWGNSIAQLPVSALSYTDVKLQTGVEYEYAIKAKYFMPIETYINAGIKCKETEYRGKLILLVDSTFVTDLQVELARYESDLVGDGWQVLRKNIARNASVLYVKSIIRDFYNSDPKNVNGVFLFGHIPVPYSGNEAYDGHIGEHDGAWPSDMYYGDMYEKLWSDKYINCTTSARSENWNVPGDGKFDVCILPASEEITLLIGRVDFQNLPAFPQSEAEHLRNYLNKNHDFRHKIIDPKMQALVDDNFGILNNCGSLESFAISGWRNFSALLNFTNTKKGDFFNNTKDDSYIWSYGCGGGKFDSCVGIGNTADFVTQNPKTVFTALYGSRFGDWDSKDNFMRAALASKGWILTSCWAGRPHYTFHQMGMGETIGYCVRATQNNLNSSNYFTGLTNRGTHTSLLGDPTLRMHIVRPVKNLKSSVMPNKTVLLSWKPSLPPAFPRLTPNVFPAPVFLISRELFDTLLTPLNASLPTAVLLVSFWNLSLFAKADIPLPSVFLRAKPPTPPRASPAIEPIPLDIIAPTSPLSFLVILTVAIKRPITMARLNTRPIISFVFDPPASALIVPLKVVATFPKSNCPIKTRTTVSKKANTGPTST